MTAEEIRLHISYSGWASRKLLEATLALPEEQQSREFGVSHKTLMGTLEHTYLGDRIWFSRIADPRVLQIEDPLPVAWPKVQKRWEDWAAAISHQDIVKNIEYKDLKGDSHRTPVWQIVLHVVNHATLHRGQAMSLLRQLGVSAPPTDLIYYYRENASIKVK
jgi:uncharacterized damage-inducible protein DinB